MTDSQNPTNSENYNPFKIIARATRAVPFVKYALGLLGIIAVISIVKALGISLRFAFWGCIIILCLMLILFLLARLSEAETKTIKGPSSVLLWGIVILFTLTIFSLFSSVFFKYPLDLCKWLDPSCGNNKNIVLAKNDTVNKKKNLEVDTLSRELKPKFSSPGKGIKKQTTSIITVSIQLKNETNGYKRIFLNGALITVLPESTKYNPRIQINNPTGKEELIIITNNGDTCMSSIKSNVDSSTYRIIPNCN